MKLVEFLLSESKKKRKKKAQRYCRKCGCFHGVAFGFGWGGHHDTDHAGSSEYAGDTYGSDSGDSGGDGGSGGE